jgi:uncharacterized protein (DUF952 family)
MVKPSTVILHICQRKDWQVAQEIGSYLADSLESEGFIHCSSVEQVAGVANTIFKGLENLVLLHIAVDKLWAELRWEEVEGEVFPHIYGPINLDAVMTAEKFTAEKDNIFRYP